MDYLNRNSSFFLFGLVFIVILYAFVNLVISVVSNASIIVLDTYLVNLFYFYREESLATFFSLATLLGSSPVVAVVAIILTAFFFVKRKFGYIFSFITTFFGTEFSVYVLKEIFHRARPPLNTAFIVENSFSFPSGHATIAVALYGFIIYILFREFRSRLHRFFILFFGVLLIFLIGLSRLYLGVHFLSDVIGGYLLGLIWLLVGMAISEILLNRKSDTMK